MITVDIWRSELLLITPAPHLLLASVILNIPSALHVVTEEAIISILTGAKSYQIMHNDDRRDEASFGGKHPTTPNSSVINVNEIDESVDRMALSEVEW